MTKRELINMLEAATHIPDDARIMVPVYEAFGDPALGGTETVFESDGDGIAADAEPIEVFVLCGEDEQYEVH